MLLLWIAVFIVSLALLVKSADWLLSGSEKAGLAMGLSPFIVGVTIVGIGTSLPELTSSLVAVFQGVPEVVAANVIGSNIANILLVVGISAFAARGLAVTKNIIDLDLPLFAASTVLFLGVIADRSISQAEGILLLVGFALYILYAAKDGEAKSEKAAPRPRFRFLDLLLILGGVAGLAFSSKFLIDSLIQLSNILNLGVGVLAITAVALGTSLPELMVSAKAALRGNSDVALGNIFGSNAINILLVAGLPALFTTLPLDLSTFSLGIPFMVAATVLFVISGISRKIHFWEGAFFILLYILFTGKLFQIF